MRRQFFTSNDSMIANERFEKVIEAIQNKDGDSLKALFSDKVLKETENLDETISELFNYFQGEMLSYNDWSAIGVDGGRNSEGIGRDWKRMRSTYDVKTSQDEYRFAMELITMDSADANNVGIRSLYVIRLEDDSNPKFAYRGDGKYTPGININKKKNR